MTIWNPDTCDCKIEYNFKVRFVRTYKKCRLHDPLSAQSLLDAITAQNRRFNSSYPNPNERQQEVIARAKRVNVERIRTEDLTNFDEHLPHEPFFSALRSLLGL